MTAKAVATSPPCPQVPTHPRDYSCDLSTSAIVQHVLFGCSAFSLLCFQWTPQCLCLSLVPGVAIVLHVTTCIIYAHLDYRPDGIWLCCCR